MFEDCSIIIEKMNQAGLSKTPFLFGLNYELSEGFFIDYPEKQTNILYQINNFSNTDTKLSKTEVYKFDSYPISFKDYKKKFDIAMSKIESGDIDLINLTIKTPIKTSLSIKDIFLNSKAKYKLYIPDKLVCFSPEIFARTNNGKIYSYPMKGTISADIPKAENIIINNNKEIEEHKTAVSLIKDDLGNVSYNIKTNRFRYIDKIENNKVNLLQVSSEVEGTLYDDFFNEVGNNILKLLPAGSISGHPRKNVLKIIHEAEQEPRGYYTGIVGYFDGENIDCGVLIRYIEKEDDKLFFRSGGGITINSNCKKEYEEVIEKIYLPF